VATTLAQATEPRARRDLPKYSSARYQLQRRKTAHLAAGQQTRQGLLEENHRLETASRLQMNGVTSELLLCVLLCHHIHPEEGLVASSQLNTPGMCTHSNNITIITVAGGPMSMQWLVQPKNK
jgi:hypothetical protein